MCGSLDYHTDKIEYLENQSRRSNIRIDGIREEEAETWDNTETKVKEILKEKLNLDEEPDIERAHRVGRRANATTGSVETSKDHRLSPPRLEAKRTDHQKCKENQAPWNFY